MRRTVALLLCVAVAALSPVPPASAAPEPPSATGWSASGGVIRWTAGTPMPPRDAGVEFWEGDRFLGLAQESADLRSFTLRASPGNPAALQVRSAGRRLDLAEPAPMTPSSAVPDLPPSPPLAAVDPGVPGEYTTTTGEYSLDPITLPGYGTPVEMKAVVVAPVGAPGRRPLALFLHGRHFTCYDDAEPARITLDWPCPAGTTPVSSYRGYLKAQELLASQGYLTVSISANSVNAQDNETGDAGAQGRSSLVRHHLAKWADWASGRGAALPVVRSAPRADLGKVLLVGHSRGGEGVNRAAIDSVTPPAGDTGFTGPVRWTIRGTVLVAPTIFGHNPAPDVPSVTLLPGCDGDVRDLQGQMAVDQTRGLSRGEALHSALFLIGANHNYFNSEWTPGQTNAPAWDDFSPGDEPDPVCSPGAATRLTAAQQQTAGATYVAAAARLFLRHDESVLPLLDGSGVRAPSAGTARVLSHAVGGARRPFVVPGTSTAASGSARVCLETAFDGTACSTTFASPHFAGLRGTVTQPDRLAVALRWSAAGEVGVVTPARPVALHDSRHLALRLAVPPNTPEAEFGVSVRDTSGRRHALGSVTITGLPGTSKTNSVWAQEVRVPLPAGLGELAALELLPGSESGEAWLIDAHGWDEGLVPVVSTRLGRVDVADVAVDEGDSGTRTHNAVITAGGSGTRVFRLFHTEPGKLPTNRLVTLENGEHRVEVPVTVEGNTRWSNERRHFFVVQALANVVVGNTTGELLVRNDDPVPSVAAIPVAGSVTEGGTLKWDVTLSAVADDPIALRGSALAPSSGAELSTTDLDADWYRSQTGEDPEPSRPLSAANFVLYLVVPEGRTSVELAVPTAVDAEAEEREQIRLRFDGSTPPGTGFEVTGVVS
ncbi:alpha/beta hydrolase family protein [Lentzea sp. NPDC060358]|uniref:alpha/beta hydrolase family protein n=1 Tax=Lentzea sp. NPDC060358 TaxID=3347103 RepID=UPI003667109F